MKVIYNTILPPRGFAAINLFGVLFARSECRPLSDTTVNHEAIHTAQQRELAWIGFYLWYVVEWLVKLPKYGRKGAYYAISFEREAYAYEHGWKYLNTRKPYAWFKYLLNHG